MSATLKATGLTAGRQATLTSTDNGWQFAQLPEHALPQDQAGIIQD